MRNKLFVIEEDPQHIKETHLSNHNFKDNFSSLEHDVAKRESVRANINKQRVVLFFLFIGLILLFFAVRLFYLQILHSKDWQILAEGNRIRLEKQIPARGVIFDRNGKTLVKNAPNFVLWFIPGYVADSSEERQNILDYLSSVFLDLDIKKVEDDILKSNSSSYEPVEILNNIPYDKAMVVMMDINNYSGLRIAPLIKREYIDYNYGMGHILGYLGKISTDEWGGLDHDNYMLFDLIGKTGIEQHYEIQMRGNMGIQEIEVDAFGHTKKVIREQNGENGDNLILTIDAELNKYLSDILCKQALKYGGKASGIALDPRNGEVLALVSCPLYNNNYFSNIEDYKVEVAELLKDTRQPLYNRSVQGEYQPGSIFKLVIASAGLEEGVINKDTTIFSSGGISIDQWFFPDWKNGGHGATNIIKAIAESVNTFFYYTGGGYKDEFQGLGINRITKYADEFGFGRKTNIDLPGESAGFLPSQEWKQDVFGRPWYIGDTYHLSIGQGDITATPIQIANLTAYFANNGILFQPHLIKASIDYRNVKTEIKPFVLEKELINKKYVDLIRLGLREAVSSGSATYLSDLPFATAGKTGTAQVGGDFEPHAWFTGFAPYENPEIVITILIENGKEGSSTAVPVAKDVLKWYFSHEEN
ncbi:MAG: penicillin-binding protein 2 [Patescibacteria group bacterium]